MPKTPGLKIPYVVTQTSIALGFIMMSLYTIYYAVLFFYRSRISGFKGQMLQESSTCTIKQLFAIFGASVRRGKQGFSVVL